MVADRTDGLAPSNNLSVALGMMPRASEDGPIEFVIGASDMDPLLALIITVAGLAGLGFGSLRWGVDSRDPYPDDHRR